jgi:hypothetical protein
MLETVLLGVLCIGFGFMLSNTYMHELVGRSCLGNY